VFLKWYAVLSKSPSHPLNIPWGFRAIAYWYVCLYRQSLLESHYWSDGNMDDLIVWLDIILHVSPFVHNPSSRFVALLLNDAWHHQLEDLNPWSGSIHCHKSRLAGTMKPKRPAIYEISTCNIWGSILYHFTQLNLYFWRSKLQNWQGFLSNQNPGVLEGRASHRCHPPSEHPAGPPRRNVWDSAGHLVLERRWRTCGAFLLGGLLW